MLDDAWSMAMRKYMLEEAPDDENLYPVPSQVTASGQRFYDELAASISVFMTFLSSAAFADNAHKVAVAITGSVSPLPKIDNPFSLSSRPSGPILRHASLLFPALATMALTKIVDNFTTYVAEVVGDCLKARPETMRSGEQVTLETIFRATSLEQLRDELVDRKINELAYLGFEKLADWISTRLGTSVLNSFPSRTAILELLEIRNCIVHNRGRPSLKYLHLRQSGLTPQSAFDIGVDELFLAVRATATCVELLDASLAAKFGLPTASPTPYNFGRISPS